jgi:chromosome segregation ATPase
MSDVVTIIKEYGWILSAVLAALASLLSSLLAAKGRKAEPEEKLEEQLATVFRGLEENSRQATQLLARLQREVTTRNSTMQEIETKLQELRQQRTLLELTPEQRQAIEGLARRRPSLRDIFTSLDFWVGRFALSLSFFVLGLLAARLGLR